jgi:hypothetical protein
MCRSEDMDPALLMTAATAARELTALPSSAHITISDLQRKTNPSQDPTEESFAEDASNPESFELSCLRKSKQSKEQSKLPGNDFDII